MSTNCRVCQTRIDQFWVDLGVDVHPTCNEPCAHGEPRGPRYCALCRRARALPIEGQQSIAPVERNTAPVGRHHPVTAKAAAARALPSTGTKRRLIYDLIAEKDGLCDWELEHAFGWKHESASAARRSLVRDGWLIDSGRTRKVPDTGNAAIIWIINPG